MWVDKVSKLCNESMKSWLQDNVVEMCSKHSEGKLFVAERFIRTLNNKFTDTSPQCQKIYCKLADIS